MDRIEAGKVLGFRDEDGKVIKLEERSKEALIDTIRSIKARHEDREAANSAAIKALEERLKIARKAKQEANRRADIAEKAMRSLLDNFKATEAKS